MTCGRFQKRKKWINSTRNSKQFQNVNKRVFNKFLTQWNRQDIRTLALPCFKSEDNTTPPSLTLHCITVSFNTYILLHFLGDCTKITGRKIIL